MTTPYSMYVYFGDELGGSLGMNIWECACACVRARATVCVCVCGGGGEYYLFHLVRHFNICWVKPVQNRG